MSSSLQFRRFGWDCGPNDTCGFERVSKAERLRANRHSECLAIVRVNRMGKRVKWRVSFLINCCLRKVFWISKPGHPGARCVGSRSCLIQRLYDVVGYGCSVQVLLWYRDEQQIQYNSKSTSCEKPWTPSKLQFRRCYCLSWGNCFFPSSFCAQHPRSIDP